MSIFGTKKQLNAFHLTNKYGCKLNITKKHGLFNLMPEKKNHGLFNAREKHVFRSFNVSLRVVFWCSKRCGTEVQGSDIPRTHH